MRIKKILSLAVVLAMVLTVVPMFGITASATETTELQFSAFVGTGSQTDANNYVTVAVLVRSDVGSDEAAPTIANVSTNLTSTNGNNMGSTRIGGIEFDISTVKQKVTGNTKVKNATLTMNVKNVHNNLGGGNWIKVGVYQTDNTTTPTAQAVPAARDGNYGSDAVIWSKDTIKCKAESKTSEAPDGNTKLEFDVKDAVNTALDDGAGNKLVLRIQVPATLIDIEKNGDNAPKLAIETAEMTTVKAVYKDGSGTELKTVESEEEVGTQYKPDDSMFIKDGELYIPQNVTEQAVTSQMEDINITCKVADRYSSFKDLANADIKTNSGIPFKIVSDKSLVINGSFDYGLAGWTSGNFDTDASTRPDYFEVTTDETDNHGNVFHDKFSDNSADGSGKPASMATRWPVDPNSYYYFAYDQHTDTTADTDGNGGIKFFNSEKAEINDLTIDNCQLGDVKVASGNSSFGDNIDGNYRFKHTKEWGRKAYIVKTTATTAYFGFQESWFADLYLDNVELYKVEPKNGTTTVTVNFYDGEVGESNKIDGKEPKTFSDLFVGSKFSYDALNNDPFISNEDYTEFKVPEKDTYEIESLAKGENKIDVVYKANDFATVDVKDSYVVDGKIYNVDNKTNLVPNPSFERKDGTFTSAGWFSPNNESKANNQPYPIVHRYDADEKYTAGAHAFGSRYRDEWNGLCSILNNFKVEAGKKYYFAYDVMPNGESHSDWAEASTGYVSGAQTAPIPEQGGSKTNTKLHSLAKNSWHTIATIIEVPAETESPYIQFNAHGIGNASNTNPGEPVASNGDDVAPFLFDNFVLVPVTEAPVDTIETALGYNDSALTIDFLTGELDEGATVEITGGGIEGKLTATAENVNATESKAVSLTTVNSNAIYTASIKNKDGGIIKQVKASLYKAVVDNLTDTSLKYGEGVKEDMIKLANEVITKGGVYFTSDNASDLNEETKKIVTVTASADAEEITVKVNDPYSTYGIGFVLKDQTICIGSKDRTFTSAEEKVYNEFKINKSDDTVTLSGGADVITLSLDSVNIEFVETLIEELEADGADTAVDFIPEL